MNKQILVTILFLTIIPKLVNAEFIFKKDGEIVKGSILEETQYHLAIQKKGGVVERINRNIIMRVLFTDLYMGKVYIRLTSGEVIEGYQVDEDRDVYVFRKDITKPAEFTVERKKVMFISRTNPTDLTSESSIDRILIKWSPPFKPAKLYKVYMREKKKGQDFQFIGETDDVIYTLKNLGKSASYEIYVTAVSDANEESLPSEKITANTLPYAPEDLDVKDKLSPDGLKVQLTLSWVPVTDVDSRVKSYTVYQIDERERKKLGNTKGTEFATKEFPAEGKHWFAVVAVNDLGTESADLKGVYDAGIKICTRISGSYLMPLGNLEVITTSGYGGLLDLTFGGKSFSGGIETGFLSFDVADNDIKSMSIIPLLGIAEYRVPLFYTISLRPVIKAGMAYQMVEYLKHDATDPLITKTISKNSSDAMASTGVNLDLWIEDRFVLSFGTEYAVLFQNSTSIRFASFTFGAALIF